MARRPRDPSRSELDVMSGPELLRLITARNSRSPRPNATRLIELLRAGYREMQSGKYEGQRYALSAGKIVDLVVRALRSGLAPEEIPVEVVAGWKLPNGRAVKFDWTDVRVKEAIRVYAEKHKVDPDDALRAFSAQTKRRRLDSVPPKARLRRA